MRALLAGLFGLGLAACSTASATTGAPVSPDAPIVLELFTSQGCSSCPPADELLAQLAHAGVSDGRAIAPLAFHVDYWNDLGWADPFSQPAWSLRQQEYARALGDRSVYTPELVVGGGAGVLGSAASRIAAAIAAAAPPARLAATATWQPQQLAVTATAPRDADVYVAVWQDGTRTKVPRGENAGETLVGERVVRVLRHIAAPGETATVTVPLSADWPAGGAIAFAQRADRRIVATARLAR